jgi:hypothetical protein
MTRVLVCDASSLRFYTSTLLLSKMLRDIHRQALDKVFAYSSLLGAIRLEDLSVQRRFVPQPDGHPCNPVRNLRAHRIQTLQGAFDSVEIAF